MSAPVDGSRRALVVDDEEDIREAVGQTLELNGFEVIRLARAERALERIDTNFDGIVISDIRMPGMDGMALLAALRERDPDLPVILITGHGDVPLAVEAMRAGAYDFVEKPFAPGRLAEAAARAQEKRRLVLEVRALRNDIGAGDPIETRLIGASPAMTTLRQQLRTVAESDLDVMILGPTGSGKGLVARLIHECSARASQPFVTVNLAALPAASIESELFGHVAGAFPGALRGRIGRFEHARGGTLFLDEIGAAPPALQAKLLRVIEERAIEPLGSSERVELDLRFIAATKEDPEALIAAGAFRDDLYYRLNAVTLHLPALAERGEDAPRLFQHFVAQAAFRLGREAPEVPPEVLRMIALADWPGNLRELQNAAERFLLGLDAPPPEPDGDTPSLASQMDRVEKSLIAAALSAHGGNLKATYESLGLSRKTLYDKMQKHGLNRGDFADEGGD